MKSSSSYALKVGSILVIGSAAALAIGLYLSQNDTPIDVGGPSVSNAPASTRLANEHPTTTPLTASFPPDPIASLTSPSNSPPPPAILCTIDDQAIPSGQFDALLMSAAGLRLFDQVANLLVAEQDCAQAGLNINDLAFQQNLQAEFDRTLRELGAAALPESQRAAALQQILRTRGMTETEFQMGLRLNACLCALARRQVTITDKTLHDAFNVEYGERLHGRLFIVRNAEEAAQIRQAIVIQGRDINEVAALCKAQNFILPMNAEGAGLDKLKGAAAYLLEKQLSGAVTLPDGTCALFYLDRKELARDDVTFDSVKDTLRANLQDQAERAWAASHLLELRRAASIRIDDPILARQYQDLKKLHPDLQDLMKVGPPPPPAP